ncbi:fimbrial protein [Achromobacter seleniivolatilans]|uniref:Fimbrial protein n=1 Tax=Achromobacter seleniivolatilans TaxID=3047478 RepID=A0ABY9LYT6_9BURK|nr:fimbrial protein [Achromobacter sp. R39]WMD19944.1 fimbrial protein [Achromobacter sp. R39]
MTSLAPIADLNMHPIGAPIPTSLASVASGVLTMSNNPEYTASYLLELVVTDSDAYAGGGMTIVQTGTLMLLAKMEPNPGTTEPAYCGGVPTPTLPPASLQAVTLPIPPTPTCEFDTATLNQTVALGAANSASVARHGTTRTAGVSGEKPFFIQAKNCGAGTIFHAYFTDALAASSTNDYLRPAGASNVGIRIYHDNDTTPVPFGPAPIGSTLPARAPITTGSVNAAQGANYSLPFTAQYVQLPDASGSASPGEMSASAKLTIVYP